MKPIGLTIVMSAMVLVSAAPAGAQWLKDKTPGIPRTADGKPDLKAAVPRTADGKPDLTGIWRVNPGGYEENLLADVKASDVLPWAAELTQQRSEEFGIGHPSYRCMPDIGPFTSFGMFKFLQTPAVTAQLSEGGTYRQILTDGRGLPVDPNPTWMGYSIGRWDGDVFVVTTAGFNDRTWLDIGGHPHTEALRVTERYRRKTFGEMEIEMTFEDPTAYTKPWTIRLSGALAPDTELLETVCNENEKSVQHFVVTDEDRRKARTRVTVPFEVLSRYKGNYELTAPDGRKMPFVVDLVDGQLVAQPPFGGKYILMPESQTVFSVSGAKITFFVDASGQPTHFVVTTVEGDQRADRK